MLNDFHTDLMLDFIGIYSSRHLHILKVLSFLFSIDCFIFVKKRSSISTINWILRVYLKLFKCFETV